MPSCLPRRRVCTLKPRGIVFSKRSRPAAETRELSSTKTTRRRRIRREYGRSLNLMKQKYAQPALLSLSHSPRATPRDFSIKPWFKGSTKTVVSRNVRFEMLRERARELQYKYNVRYNGISLPLNPLSTVPSPYHSAPRITAYIVYFPSHTCAHISYMCYSVYLLYYCG